MIFVIQINLRYNRDDKISGYRVSGHSGTEIRGKDIVCAGVSSLAQSALLGIGKHLHRDIDFHIDPSGDLRLSLKDEPDDLTEAILQTMRLGLIEIERISPGAVSIRESRDE